jgi:SAM-dependent methyltransferase
MIKLLLWVDNFIYKLISYLAIKREGLHPKHRLTNYHKFFTDNVSKKDTVLDIGCGNGALTYELGRNCKTITGIDIKTKYPYECAGNVEIIRGDVLDWKLPKYDTIVLSNVLEHIKDRFNLLKRIHQISKKFLIRVPMIDRDWLTLYKKELGVEYRLDKGHFIEYTQQSFEQEVKEAGYKIVKLEIRFGEIYSILK